MSDEIHELVRFFMDEIRVDARIVTLMTDELGFETITDFAHYWTSDEYQQGVEEDIVALVPAFARDLSAPGARLQVSRLRRAWEVARLGRPPDPPTVAYGLLSEPMPDCSYAAVFAAVELTLFEPWRVIDVDEASCMVDYCEGGLERRMRLGSSGTEVIERVIVREEVGEVIFQKFEEATGGAQGRAPSATGECRDGRSGVVLALHVEPLRLEIFARGADLERVSWPAPRDEAAEALAGIARLAREFEAGLGEAGEGPEEVREPAELDYAAPGPELPGAIAPMA